MRAERGTHAICCIEILAHAAHHFFGEVAAFSSTERMQQPSSDDTSESQSGVMHGCAFACERCWLDALHELASFLAKSKQSGLQPAQTTLHPRISKLLWLA